MPVSCALLSGARGKRGGIRTIYYYGGGDVPIFLLAIVKKGERADLSQAEKNALREELRHLADDYRTAATKRSLRALVKQIGKVTRKRKG